MIKLKVFYAVIVVMDRREVGMCLAVPSEIVKVEGGMATVDAGGVKRSVSLMLLDDAKIGDYVIVHAGFAIKILDQKLALESLELLKEASIDGAQ